MGPEVPDLLSWHPVAQSWHIPAAATPALRSPTRVASHPAAPWEEKRERSQTALACPGRCSPSICLPLVKRQDLRVPSALWGVRPPPHQWHGGQNGAGNSLTSQPLLHPGPGAWLQEEIPGMVPIGRGPAITASPVQ